jgi:hypothetical protein
MSTRVLRGKIRQAVEDDPTVFQKSLDIQLVTLIIEPLVFSQTHLWTVVKKLLLPHLFRRSPFLVIIDGLDECKSTEEQCDILHSIATIINLHHLLN